MYTEWTKTNLYIIITSVKMKRDVLGWYHKLGTHADIEGCIYKFACDL